jgi:endonuclease/exonuclease/phosphatase family metal-dependent hydrolase
VNVQLQNAGPSTIFAQQYHLLLLAGVLIPNPRQQCIDDLHRTVVKMIANQETVMIMGDFNESLGSDPRLMGSVCASHDLFDVISNFHGESAETRGTKRLD